MFIENIQQGTEDEKTIYFHYVLEAKLIVGDMALSMASEFIENPSENFEKQDCEIKAFYRLAEKMKKMYPRLPMCLLLDSLYANKKVFEICKVKKWKYEIRFERGSIPTLAEDFEGLKKTTEVKKEGEKDTYIFFNDIEYNEYKQNVIEYTTPTCKCHFRLYIIN